MNNNATRSREATKYVAGPGGFSCDCCRIGRKAEAKRNHSRIVRRRDRVALRVEVSRGEHDGE